MKGFAKSGMRRFNEDGTPTVELLARRKARRDAKREAVAWDVDAADKLAMKGREAKEIVKALRRKAARAAAKKEEAEVEGTITEGPATE